MYCLRNKSGNQSKYNRSRRRARTRLLQAEQLERREVFNVSVEAMDTQGLGGSLGDDQGNHVAVEYVQSDFGPRYDFIRVKEKGTFLPDIPVGEDDNEIAKPSIDVLFYLPGAGDRIVRLACSE